MSVSLCVLRIEIDEDLPEMGDNPTEMEAAKEQKKKDRGARESKTITVETYASVLTGPITDTGILPTSSRRSPPENSVSEDDDTISFFCGNPLVEVTKGVLHLYKENEMKEAEEAKTLCLLSVPGALGATDLLAFAAACQQDIAHVRVLRDGSPDHYMALFTFRTSHAAREFHETFDGVPYSSLEPNALCHMAWVSRVEWARDGTPPPSHTELPTCPVCLERMDESVAGVLSVQCAHAFHADCLARWRDARCPVCRCAQTPEPRGGATCFQCERAALAEEDGDETRENISGVAEGLLDGVEAGTLWICLICGHVGCGRYEGGHAAKHFLASNHTYALQLGSNRVWDYAGDNFVHRLVQNKADGKLVAAEGGLTSEDSACGGEKLDSAQLEFTYILTQQLDSQRMFYEERMAKLESDYITECEKLRARATEAEATSSKLSEQVHTLTKDNKTLERKLNQVTNKLSSLQSELSEERGLAAALASSQAEWQARAKVREENFVKEVSELKEQLRDVMFFVEARGQLQQQAGASPQELQAASVSVAPPPKPRRKRRQNNMLEENQNVEEPPTKKQKINNINTSDTNDKQTEDTPPASTEQDTGGCLDKYGNFVTHEELEKLREFVVLDEVKSNEEDSNDDDSDSSDGVPEEEIDKMLEEDLPEGFKGVPKPKEKAYITRQKIVLEEKGLNHFEVLPLDWIMVRHISGMPIYMHRASRVCTLSKPYFIGKGNTRRHDIPISAIPCFAYRRALEEEEKQKEIDRRIAEQIRTGTWATNTKTEVNDNSREGNESAAPSDTPAPGVLIKEEVCDPPEMTCPLSNGDFEQDRKPEPVQAVPLSRQPVVLPGGLVMPPPRVETINTSWKTQHLPAEQVTNYCKNLFKFKTVNIMHFKRWADRRKYTKARKTLQYPTLPEGTKLITIPAQPGPPGQDNGAAGKSNKRDWVMNMNGRSYLSVFHEYVRRALQKQPVYEFKQLENAATPYQATVYIGGMQYGVGHGSSKRQAKSAAARSSIHILIPEMKDELDANAPNPTNNSDSNEPDFTFFDYVGIEDPRITEFCAATCEPSPHAILRTCLLRNFGAGDRHINTEMKKLEFQKIELTMKVGKHTATVVCKNKKTAKQRASQAILQALHPHVRSWGSLLRLYGSRSVKSCKEKKMEEQQITLLQDKARHNEPNYAVLEKLRNEMRKLRERDEAVVPIGTLLVSEDLPTHSGSNLNNVDL